MEVIQDNEDQFHIASHPSIMSQAVFFGLFAFACTISFYSESIFLQFLYVIGSFVIASSFIDHWQKLVVDKVSKKLHYNVQNIYYKILMNDKYLINETLDLRELKQLKCNTHNGTITFYHDLFTINVYIGEPDKCKAMLKKFKSLLPNLVTIQQEVAEEEKDKAETSEDSPEYEQLNEPSDVETEQNTQEKSQSVERDTKDERSAPKEENVEAIGSSSSPISLSCDNVKDDDEDQSSDDSFVQIDEKELEDLNNLQDTTLLQFKIGSEESEVTPSEDPADNRV